MIEIVFPGTLAQALTSTKILAGSRLLLRGGNYTVGDLAPTISNVTITNYPGEQATIVPASATRCLLLNNVSGITVDGLIFDGSNISNECVKITGTSSNITLQNCEMKNGHTHGVLMSGSGADVVIDTCHVHHNGTDNGVDHGVYFSHVNGATLTGCEIDHNAGHGVHIYGDGEGYSNTVTGNNIHDNSTGIGCYYGTVTATGNTITSFVSYGIRMQYQVESAEISGNEIGISSGMQVCVYVADLSVAGATMTVTGNNIHDAATGLWIRNQAAAGCSVVWQNNTLTNITTPTLVENTNIALV